jgi:hypothetical protein
VISIEKIVQSKSFSKKSRKSSTVKSIELFDLKKVEIIESPEIEKVEVIFKNPVKTLITPHTMSKKEISSLGLDQYKITKKTQNLLHHRKPLSKPKTIEIHRINTIEPSLKLESHPKNEFHHKNHYPHHKKNSSSITLIHKL